MSRQEDIRNEYEAREARRLARREANRKRRQRERLVRLILLLAIPVFAIAIVVGSIIGIVKGANKKHKEKEEAKITQEIETVEIATPTPEPTPEPTPSFVATAKAHSAESTDATRGFNDEMTSPYCILIDTTTGKIIGSRSGKDRMVPASMTKVLTVLTAARHIEESELDNVIEVSFAAGDYAYRNDCSIVGFSTGEKVTVRDLFYGTILSSGGDAAYALAEYVAGDMDSFVDMMNETVDDLGLSQTSHFTNPVGIYNENLYTTPYDMCMIMWAAQDNAFLHDVLEAHTYTTSKTEEHPDGILISNWFLRRIEDKDCGLYVAGGKTGFVNESGSCAVSYATSEDGHAYICCTGGAHSSWRAIYDHVEAYKQR